VYLCICPHDNLKTIADICFLLGSYLRLEKISYDFACQDHFFSEGSRSSDNALSYCGAGSKVRPR